MPFRADAIEVEGFWKSTGIELSAMIPLKLTAEERQAIWADYCRRRNWARLGILLVLAILYLLLKITPYLSPRLQYINWVSVMAVILVPIGIVVGLYLSIKRWTEWKCPQCGNRFALNQYFDRDFYGLLWPLFFIVWRSIYSSRCGYCGKSAMLEQASRIP